MEEAQEILLNSLENSGVQIPSGVSSIQDLTPTSLFSICSQSLRIVHDDTSSFPTSLPESMTEQFKICTEMAEAIKNLGYIGDMSFHKFLYPSEEDLYKLVRFLIEKLSESSEGGSIADKRNINIGNKIKENDTKSPSYFLTERTDTQGVDDPLHQKVGGKLTGLKLKTEVSESWGTKDENVLLSKSHEACIVPSITDDVAVDDVSRSRIQDSCKEELTSVETDRDLLEEFVASRRDASGNEETVSELAQKLSSLNDNTSKLRCKIENIRNQEKFLMEEVTEKNSELQHIEEEHELLKAAVDMAFDDQHPVHFYIEQLNAKVDAKRRNLVELELQWEASTKILEEKKRSLEESLCATKPEIWEKYQKLKEVEQETQCLLSEIRKREEEHSKLSADLAKQPKVPPRRSYIQRITEITKNSRKQDADIERILKETRELQLESNSIQERLHRTYAVVDETVFREAKKDPVGKQAYKLLTSIHESFELISEKILATDRIRREAADHEAKLAGMASRSLNIDKLQADLDAIKKENEYLEQHIRD